MPAKKAVGRKVPKGLLDRRKLPFHEDKIWTRDWSKNRLGEAFLKRPEPMQRGRFYSRSEGGSPEEYKMHKMLQQKIRHLIGARPFRQYGLVFFKGESGAFYVRLKGISSDRFVYIRADKPEIAKALGFLFK